jgi:hypothetical protein
MAGRPPKEKSFANMLNIAIREATASGGTKLRAVADALIEKAIGGDVSAIREVADRIDGKVAQAIVGELSVVRRASEMTDDELAAIAAESSKRAAATANDTEVLH